MIPESTLRRLWLNHHSGSLFPKDPSVIGGSFMIRACLMYHNLKGYLIDMILSQCVIWDLEYQYETEEMIFATNSHCYSCLVSEFSQYCFGLRAEIFLQN